MRALNGIVVAAMLAALAGCGEKPAAKSDARNATSATATATAPAAQTSMGWPKRKAGLWTQTTNMEAQNVSQTFRFCIDDATDAKLGLYADRGGVQCVKDEMSRTADGGWTASSTCDLGAAGKTQSTIQVKGDFGRHYEMTVDTNTTGAAQPAMNGQHRMTMTADWSGACPAGWSGGDIELPGGQRMNLLTKKPAGG